jgi:hypothetical protein
LPWPFYRLGLTELQPRSGCKFEPQPRRLSFSHVRIRVVWIILVFELVFQVLIRPSDYHDILHTEKAFLPSTARHINSFHLTYEALALILFFPHVICTLSTKCVDGPFLSRAKAPLLALTSASRFEAVLGRLDLSLTFLRAFGLIRHWKQMWIRSAFEAEKKDEGTSTPPSGKQFLSCLGKVSCVNCSLVVIRKHRNVFEGGRKT